MLHAFLRLQNQHQDEQPATDSQLPIDAAEAIQYALSRSSLDLLVRIKARGDSLNTPNRRKSPLIQAVVLDDADGIRLLIQAGVDVNFRTRTGESALDIAVNQKKQAALEALLTDPNLNLHAKNKLQQSALQLALNKKNLKAFIAIARRCDSADQEAKTLVNQYLYAAVKGKKVEEVTALIQLPQCDIETKFKQHSLLHWVMKTNNLSLIKMILPLSRRNANIPLSVLIKDHRFFNTLKNCQELYDTKNQIDYLDAFSLSEPQVIAALRILEIDKMVAEREAERKKIGGNESAMDDAKVRAANRHFDTKVKPHFDAQFKQLGLHQIECNIRELIINEIKEHAVLQNDEATQTFIKQNHSELVKGTENVLRDSVKVFNRSVAAQAAWRCYNPFAPVAANWPNLLTRPLKDESVFSTQATNFVNGTLKSQQASDIVRERAAYYYLAVVDKGDGDEQTRINRKGNFIGLLAEIRNTHGANDPSCFPGQLTRIAQMGNYHTIAQQPSDFKSELTAFFTSKIFDTFKKRRDELHNDFQQVLLRALVDLNHLTAKDVIYQPNKYTAKLLKIRQDFSNLLENEIVLFEQFKQTTTCPLDAADLVYFKQHLLDLTRGDIANCLEQYERLKTDRHTTVDDLVTLNPFGDDEKKAQVLFAELLKHVQQTVPRYRDSFHQLQAFADFAVFRVKQLLLEPENRDQYLHDLVEIMDLTDNKQAMLQAFEDLLKVQSIVKKKMIIANPFEQQLKQMEQTIKHTPHPGMVVQLKKRLPALQQKVELFKLFVPYLSQENLRGAERASLIQMAKSAVEYAFHNDAFEPAAFKQSLREEGELSVPDEQCDGIINDLTKLFPENYRHKTLTLKVN